MSKKGIELFNKGQDDEAFRVLTNFVKNTKKVACVGYYEAHNMIDVILERHTLSEERLKWIKDLVVKAKVYYFGSGVERDYKKVVETLKESDSHIGLYLLGNMYSNGSGVEKNDTKAIELFKQSAEKGNRDAQYTMGSIVDNIAEKKRYYKMSGSQGHHVAQLMLGKLYETYDDEMALRYLDKCESRGNKLVSDTIDILYEKIYPPQAIYRYEQRITKSDNIKLYKKLLRLYNNNICNTKDSVYKNDAIKLYKKIGYDDDPEAMYRMAVLIKSDDSELSAHLFHLSADLGQRGAQYYIGRRYLYGREECGIKQDQERGLKYIRMSANNGHSTAYLKLGNLYFNGLESAQIKKDPIKAISLYKKGLIQTHSVYMWRKTCSKDKCRNKLAKIYSAGIFVPKDNRRALFYSRNEFLTVRILNEDKVLRKDIILSVYQTYQLDRVNEWTLSDRCKKIKKMVESENYMFITLKDDGLTLVKIYLDRLKQKSQEISNVLNKTILYVTVLQDIIRNYILHLP